MNALPDRVGAFSWIVKGDNMNSSRSGSRKQGSGKLLTLHFDSQVNSRKWNSTYLLAIVDKVRVLHGCFFDIIVFSFIVVFFFFPTYAQNISLCGFIRYTYVHSTYFFNFEDNDQRANLLLFTHVFLLYDNNSWNNNIHNHNNNMFYVYVYVRMLTLRRSIASACVAGVINIMMGNDQRVDDCPRPMYQILVWYILYLKKIHLCKVIIW